MNVQKSSTRTLLIGSSRGIGLAISRMLLDNGHFVHGVSRTSSPITHQSYLHSSLDISLADQFVDFLTSIKLPSFDNFIVVAGTNNVRHLNQLSINDLHDLFSVNFIPSFLLTTHLAKSLSNSPSRHLRTILLFGSIWSTFGIKGRSLYGTSKSALVGFARHACSELSDFNCLINVLSPGFVDTGLTSKTSSDPLIAEAMRRSGYKLIPPDSLYPIVNSLIAPLNTCISGQEFFADFGFSAHA